MSEAGAYDLAVDYAAKYAPRHHIDLSAYEPPPRPMSKKTDQDLYVFSWKPKTGDGTPLTMAVGARNVDVSVVQSPNWED